MRKTQLEQLKEAKRAYLLPLNQPRDGMLTKRFSVYLETKSGLTILWPSDNHKKKSKELLFNQVYSKRPKYPAYHFALNGCGYYKALEIAKTLKRACNRKDLEVYELHGGMPSLIQ